MSSLHQVATPHLLFHYFDFSDVLLNISLLGAKVIVGMCCDSPTGRDGQIGARELEYVANAFFPKVADSSNLVTFQGTPDS